MDYKWNVWNINTFACSIIYPGTGWINVTCQQSRISAHNTQLYTRHTYIPQYYSPMRVLVPTSLLQPEFSHLHTVHLWMIPHSNAESEWLSQQWHHPTYRKSGYLLRNTKVLFPADWNLIICAPHMHKINSDKTEFNAFQNLHWKGNDRSRHRRAHINQH